jgi:hypothetical protein
MPLNDTDIKILNFLYSERQRDIYHPPHIDSLVQLTGLPHDQAELAVRLLNIKDYVYTYHAHDPIKITASGIDFVERSFAGERFQNLVKGKSAVLAELKSVYDDSADRWVTNDHLSGAAGIHDRMHLYCMVEHLAQKKLVELRSRALGFFHVRLSEHGHMSITQSGEAVCA